MSYALRHTDLRIQADKVWLDAFLSHAPDVRGLVLCVSPWFGRLRDSREDYAARVLRDAGYATLLVSLLSAYEESRDPELRYDVSLLATRLQTVMLWVQHQPQLGGLPLGLQALGTVAAAGVRAIAREPETMGERIGAIVARSARADLAGAEPLRRLRVPTLMVMPGQEAALLPPAEQAYALIGADKAWKVVPYASVDFIEPGSLEAAASSARDWFLQHLPAIAAPADGESHPDSATDS